MIFFENLRWGPKALDNKKSVLKDLKKKKYLPGVYLITLASNESNLLDITEAHIFLQPKIDTSETVVVGITYGKEEALELVRRIVDEAYTSLGEVNIKKYLGID